MINVLANKTCDDIIVSQVFITLVIWSLENARIRKTVPHSLC